MGLQLKREGRRQMAGNGMPKEVRRRMYAFARSVARPFSDSRRRGFLEDMIPGLIISGHVHLSKIARAVYAGDTRIHGVEKSLSGHLGSQHWDMSPVADDLRQRSARMVNDNTLIVADLTDLAKAWAKKMEGLGRVHDGSDPEQRIKPGYMVLEAYVRVGKWQLFPLALELLKTYSGAPTSENTEILQYVRTLHEATGGKGTWLWDRGADRNELMLPWLKQEVAFVIRQRGDRYVCLADGSRIVMKDLAEQLKPKTPAGRWPRRGHTKTVEVWLPDDPDHGLLLVLHWRRPSSEPLLLVASPQARRFGRRAEWFLKAYRRRWGVEDATRGIKQMFHLEQFLVRTWRAIRRLLTLVAVAFYWLNLWGDEKFDRLRKALLNHPWRLPKEVTYAFAWIASQIQQILHPRPMLGLQPDSNSG
jgi:hypothetical protein